MIILIANLIQLVAVCTDAYGNTRTDKRTYMTIASLSTALAIIPSVMLGAYTNAAVSVVAIGRNTAVNKGYRGLKPFTVCTVALVSLTVFTYTDLWSLVPVFCVIVTTLNLFMTDDMKITYGVAILTTAKCIPYSFVIQNYVSVVRGIILLSIEISTYYRLLKA